MKLKTHQVVRNAQGAFQVIFKGSENECRERVAFRAPLGHTGDRIEETPAYAERQRKEARKLGCL